MTTFNKELNQIKINTFLISTVEQRNKIKNKKDDEKFTKKYLQKIRISKDLDTEIFTAPKKINKKLFNIALQYNIYERV